MRLFSKPVILFLVGINLAFSPSILLATPKKNLRFSQIVLPFKTQRDYTYSFDQHDNSLVLELQKTSAAELENLDLYDEKVIRRIYVKEILPLGTELHIILKDQNLKTAVTHYFEPFRVVIDIFDTGYRETPNPKTGLPLLSAASSNEGNSALETSPITSDDSPVLAQQKDPLPLAPEDSGDEGTDAKRKLLQPLPEMFKEPRDLIAAMEKIPAGKGKAWQDYPPYVYRLQTAAHEGQGETVATKNEAAVAMSSMDALADYAKKLFDFGQEARALVIYQQVLQKKPSIFETNVLHLWNLAEAHLSQGNLTLADGYFTALTQRFKENPLAKFAQIRRLDIASIRLIRQNLASKLHTLASNLDDIKPYGNSELISQIAIRKVYWHQKNNQGDYDKFTIPIVTTDLKPVLSDNLAKVESQKTAFLVSTLLLNEMTEPQSTWTKNAAIFANEYFQRFSGSAAEPFRTTLRDKLQQKLDTTLQQAVANKKYLEAIQYFEDLPRPLQSIKKTPLTAWALAEAYRSIGQYENAVPFYETSAKSLTDPKHFRSLFWIAVLTGDLAVEMGETKSSPAKLSALTKRSKQADQEMRTAWESLNETEKRQTSVVMKAPLEDTLKAKTLLRTPAEIIFSNWTAALSASVAASAGDDTNWQQSYSPSATIVALLSDLAKRFGELSLQQERKSTLHLMAKLKLNELNLSKEVKDIWTNQMLSLAEEYRKSNQWLESGKLYTLAANESKDWEKRAETLYKGGLLLYRAGKREEAIDAFKKASEDGNNLFYANLAKERLAQLEK